MSADHTSYAQVISQLPPAYDRSAAERDAGEKSEWKLTERRTFLERLRAEGKTRLLENASCTQRELSVCRLHTGDVGRAFTARRDL